MNNKDFPLAIIGYLVIMVIVIWVVYGGVCSKMVSRGVI